MKQAYMFSGNCYKIEGHNPRWNDPLYIVPATTHFKKMLPWQQECFGRYKNEKNLSIQAACGSKWQGIHNAARNQNRGLAGQPNSLAKIIKHVKTT